MYQNYIYSRNLASDKLDEEGFDIIEKGHVSSDFRFVEVSENLPHRARFWRSIILSSSGKTMFPYCLYLRFLDFMNLEDLFLSSSLDDPMDTDQRPTCEMVQIVTEGHLPGRFMITDRGEDYDDIIEYIGNAIFDYIHDETVKTKESLNLEVIKWRNDSGALAEWLRGISSVKALSVPCLPSLRITWPESLAMAIVDHCPNFCSLILTIEGAEEVDEDEPREQKKKRRRQKRLEEEQRGYRELAQFFMGLRENTLQKFLVHYPNESAGDIFADQDNYYIDLDMFDSLDHNHAQSLRQLKISTVYSTTIQPLSRLRNCQNLTSLWLEFPHSENIVTDIDMLHGAIRWIISCGRLREIGLSELRDGMEVLTYLCGTEGIRLRKVQLLGFETVDNGRFFKVLSSQAALKHLELKPYDYSNLGKIAVHHEFMDPQLSFTSLEHLNMDPIFGAFSKRTILNFAPYISRVKTFTFKCNDMDDDLWPALANFHQLQHLEIQGYRAGFTYGGIRNYIDTLTGLNKGYKLCIFIDQTWGRILTPVQEANINNALYARTGGELLI
ncbi:hypothetical protein K3495_g7542 [Podosphaera aphanis]|nr:hypothetical protein K3495_g7542 [Podosphaera aphanis]